MGQIKAAVLAGELGPGDPLPSIRQLATDLELNSKIDLNAWVTRKLHETIVEFRDSGITDAGINFVTYMNVPRPELVNRVYLESNGMKGYVRIGIG